MFESIIRFIRGLMLAAGFIIVFAFGVLYNNLGWIVGVGGYGYYERVGAVSESLANPQYVVDSMDHPIPKFGVRKIDLNSSEEIVRFESAAVGGRSCGGGTADPNWRSRSATSFTRQTVTYDTALYAAYYAKSVLIKHVAKIRHIEPEKVKLPHIPPILINVGRVPYANNVGFLETGIRGMCIAGEEGCNQPDYVLHFYSTIFQTEVSFPDNQVRAMHVLNWLSTDDFWQKTFELNHLHLNQAKASAIRYKAIGDSEHSASDCTIDFDWFDKISGWRTDIHILGF